MPAWRVDADGLNFRSEPSARRRRSIIAVLRRGHEVEKLSELRSGWWQVRTQVDGREVEGFLASRYLTPAADFDEPPAHHGAIPAVHMLKEKGRRDVDGLRVFPLGENNQPRHQGNTQPGELVEVVNYLDVENSLRYRRKPNTTYCNIYAYDYCYLAGVYLPRVWWMDQALVDLGKGKSVRVSYGGTIRELTANSLFEWLSGWGGKFGWVRALSLTELQTRANAGDVCLIVARRKETNRPGHICAVVPETAQVSARRQGQEVLNPVQSQAGARNHRFRALSPWWTQSKFEAFGFWHTRQTKPSVDV